jgi:hypothetical protein
MWHPISKVLFDLIDITLILFIKNKPCLLFLWSILMIVMLLTDGIVTVLALRQHQQQVDLILI